MNKQRRAEIRNIIDSLNEIKTQLDSVAYDEQFAFDNLTEGLQCSMRGEKIEECAETLSEAVDGLDNIISNLEDTIM